MVVPDRRDLVRIIRRVALRQRTDQRLLDGACAVHKLKRPPGRVMGRVQRPLEVDRVKGLPLLVVVRAGGIGDAPIGHGAGGIVLRSLAETAHGFLMVIAVAPDQAAIEPRLSVRRLGRDRPAVLSQIVIGRHRNLLGWHQISMDHTSMLFHTDQGKMCRDTSTCAMRDSRLTNVLMRIARPVGGQMRC